jgi:hypothetical protein
MKLVLLIFLSFPLYAAQSFVAACNGMQQGGGGTTINCSSTLNVQAGDTLIVYGVAALTQCSSITFTPSDSDGSEVFTFPLPGGTISVKTGTFTGQCIKVWVVKNAIANAAKTMTMGASPTHTFWGIMVAQLRETDNTAPVDAVAETLNSPNNSSTTSFVSSSFSTANAHEAVVGALVLNSNADTITAGTCPSGSACTLAAGSVAATTPFAAIEYELETSIQTTKTMAISSSSGAAGVFVTEAFIQAASTAVTANPSTFGIAVQ